ncbi:hypothetical protein [Zavarzinella formosa]|uniref:hypothetical protein n=1 Tax=Zavarzinella formosa TaxID=360055 RepID=UPI0002DC2442|nr:hypothetical protein [Zavarzinella formosa]
MSRYAILLGLVFANVNFLLAGDELPPAGKFTLADGQVTAKEFVAMLETNSGLKIDISAIDASAKVPGPLKETSYWAALEHLAKHTESHLSLVGGKIALKSGAETVIPDLHGPFRFAVHDVALRKDLITRQTICDLHLEIAWLPTVHAYRIDASPLITSVTDETGMKYAVGSGGARTFTSGITSPLVTRPLGLKRTSKSLNVAGSVQLTIADEMLAFSFNALKPAAAPNQQGVSAAISKVGNAGANWYVDVELSYPPTSAVWESHEIYWIRNNRLRLAPPTGEPIKSDDAEYGDRSIRYLFKNRAGKVGADWKLEYQTPGPMRELRVPFELKGIELP